MANGAKLYFVFLAFVIGFLAVDWGCKLFGGKQTLSRWTIDMSAAHWWFGLSVAGILFLVPYVLFSHFELGAALMGHLRRFILWLF